MAADLNILLVEDHDALREVTLAALARHGYRARGVSCAEEVSEACGAERVDVFLIDLGLPDEDGLALAARIRASQPEVGIIIMTARAEQASRVAGYQQGADIYLAKPVSPEELIAALRSLARRLSPQRPPEPLRFTVDRAQLLLKGAAGQSRLSEAELALLVAWSCASAQRLEFWQIVGILGQFNSDVGKAALEVRMVRLRKKFIEAGGQVDAIRSVRLIGYELTATLLIS